MPKIKAGDSPKPLNQNKNFYDLGQGKSREVDTFDTFVDSSWYYARFTSAENNKKALDENSEYGCQLIFILEDRAQYYTFIQDSFIRL